MKKLMTIEEAVKIINDGDILGIGGNVLHRAPMALVREIIRSKKKKLKLVKTAGALDVDMLCLSNSVESVDAGFISYESEFGLAEHYRKAVQLGEVKANEHACYTVISALRASAYGIPFMPVKGLVNSELIEYNEYFERIEDPFSKKQITVVKSIKPDVAIIHVQESDVYGNFRIKGPKYDDLILAKASKKVIISTEEIIDTNELRESERKADIPHFMVTAVVHIPKGATPCSCYGLYNIDRQSIIRFKNITNENELDGYLDGYRYKDKGANYE